MDQKPHQNSPPFNQTNENYNMNYSNNNAFNQPGNLPKYPPQYNPYQPYQYNYPKKRSNTAVIIIAVIVGLLILLVGVYFGAKFLSGKQSDNRSKAAADTPGNTVSEQKSPRTKEGDFQIDNPAAEENKPQESKSKNVQESPSYKEEGKAQYIEDPYIYLPKPSMRYTFEYHYPDGESGNLDIVTGIIPGFSIITEVELIEQSEAFTQHYVDGPDGIYVFSDEEFNERSSLWLPFNAKPGDIYHDEGGDFKIIELGAACDLGYKKLDNCLVMEVDHLDVGVIYDCYISPGLGTVLIKDKANGSVVMKLISEAAIPEKDAQDIVNRYSPNATGRPN